MSERFPIIRFHQFSSDDPDDELIMFAAPAGAIARWAGIPRKGWRIRMLYQRWVTPGRERDVKAFWDDAGDPHEGWHKFLLGPTALTLAATTSPDITEDGIALSYQPVFSVADEEFVQLSKAAAVALATIKPRLETDELAKLNDVADDLGYTSTEYEPNHILQSAIQIAQLAYDAEEFCVRNEIRPEERAELLEALDALCRPALVVDGQHRLLGATLSRHDVVLPVVLIPRADWLEQIYQFVVINETAKRVQGDLLTDIFGNSLTPQEQTKVRVWLSKSHVQVESRISAVVAGTHPDSPFKDLVRLQLGGSPTQGYITEITIRQLIEGGRGATPGWRTDPDFYNHYIQPTLPDVEAWESWTTGLWRSYWFAFWEEVGNYYNAQSDQTLWGSARSNLTKAVTLRLMQELFISIVVDNARTAEKAATSLREVLASRMSEDEIDALIAQETAKTALPSDLHAFRQFVREEFLSDGVPVRVFERPWVSSLDDEAGTTSLRFELRKAYDLSKMHERYRAQNKEIFAVEDRDGS